jgi:hypothetical protein
VGLLLLEGKCPHGCQCSDSCGGFGFHLTVLN